jgi:hypothetical protein
MSEFAKQAQSYNEQLTQVREEVEKLEFWLEALCEEQNSEYSYVDTNSILAVSQGITLPALELY